MRNFVKIENICLNRYVWCHWIGYSLFIHIIESAFQMRNIQKCI